MRKVKVWINDYLHLARGLFYYFQKPPKHYLGYIVPDKSPVILIPGIGGRWNFLKKLGDKISLAGHPVYIVPDLGHNFKSIPRSAEIVRKVIDDNNLKDMIIVAHSKGGLIGKYILVYLNSDKRVKQLVALATPFSGSHLARIVPHKSFHELLPDSEVIQDLSKHMEVNNKIISVYPIYDNSIWHKNGPKLDGAKNIEVKVAGHHKIIFDKKSLDLVLDLLK